MILCIGEVLADLIGESHDGIMRYQRFPGGAPLNVAVGIKRLGGNVGFIGTVGDDIIGRYLLEYTASVGFDYLDLNLDQMHNTTLAFLDNKENGERSFTFSRFNTADYLISQDRLDIISDFDIIHVGTLMLREEIGRKLAYDIIKMTHRYNKLVSIDVNFREDIFNDREYAIEVYKEYIKMADIIKLSLAEVKLFTGQENYIDGLDEICNRDQMVFVTLGEKGAYYRCGKDSILVPAKEVQVIDKTGAGDAFYACVLKYLDENNDYSLSYMENVLRHANICGGLACTKKGAISALPTEKLLDVVYKEYY